MPVKLESFGVGQSELARVLGLRPAAVNRKVRGSRPWFQQEIDSVLAYLTGRLARPVSYEEVFGNAPTPLPTPTREADPESGQSSDPAAGVDTLPAPAAGEEPEVEREYIPEECTECSLADAPAGDACRRCPHGGQKTRTSELQLRLIQLEQHEPKT